MHLLLASVLAIAPLATPKPLPGKIVHVLRPGQPASKACGAYKLDHIAVIDANHWVVVCKAPAKH